MKVSVLMPVYNGEIYLREAIDSVLNQTFSDFEFIIINDGSIDSTEEIILSFNDERIIYIKNPCNLGVAKTLNKGIACASGEYIARMDSDDISLPHRFEKQVAFLDRHSNIAVLGTAAELFNDQGIVGNSWSTSNSKKMKEELFFSCGLAHPTVMMRKDVILGLGSYDPEFDGLEDYELWCRVAEKYEVTSLPEILFRYRIHAQQVTKNPSPLYLQRLQHLKERQLSKIGISPQCDEAQAYYDYCIGKVPSTYEKVELFDRFAKIGVHANSINGYYEDDFLRNDFRSVLIRSISQLSTKEQKRICEESTFVNYRDVQKHQLKKWIKNLIGRQ